MGDIMRLLKKRNNDNEIKLYQAIGIINNIVVENEYKICPECGRIYHNEENMNYCSQCTGEPLRTMKIKIE